MIASGATSDKNRLDTGTLGWNDIRNKADYSVESSSASMSSSGNTTSQFMGNMANGMLAGLNNDGSAASTTGSAVADGTIVIRDKEKQTQDVAELSRDTDNAHSTLAPIFDAAKEQQRIDENRAIAQIGSQVADIVRTEGKIAAQEAAKNPDNLAAAKAALEAEGKTPTGEDIARRAYDTALNDYGTGSDKQKAVQAITAAIQGLTGGDWGSAVAGAAAPYMAEYIKTHTAEGAQRIISHALAGAVVAEMQGGNAAAGAAGAGLSAAGAKYIAEALYPGKDIKNLSEEEKQGVVALATLASGIAGGVVGGDVSSGIDGAKGGKNEVENNSLSGDKARAAVKESAEEMKARVREKMGDNLASQLTNGVLNAVSEAGDVAMAGGDTILDAAMALASCATGDSYCSTAISDLSKKDQAAGNVLNSLVSGDAWNAIQTTAVKASQGDQVALENLAGILTGIVVPSSKVTFSGKGSSVTEQTAKSTNSFADYVKENIALSKKSRESSNFSQFIKAEGAIQESLGIWPPNRGAYGPVEQVTLPTGTVVDRYGYPGGSFVSPVGVPFENRALPSSYETTKPYFQYEIIKPVPDVPKSNILPWFGQKGTGTQYELPQSVQWYLDNDYMKKVEK